MKERPVRELQKRLRALSKANNRISPVIVDGIFGEQTERALKDFQKAYSLKPTGRADKETLEKLERVFCGVFDERRPPAPLFSIPGDLFPILPGSKLSCLTVIQAVLKYLSGRNPAFPDLEITGIHDEKSVEAVKALQKICGLAPNGTINKKTWDSLALICEAFAEGDEFKQCRN